LLLALGGFCLTREGMRWFAWQSAATVQIVDHFGWQMAKETPQSPRTLGMPRPAVTGFVTDRKSKPVTLE
jgi:hypothetical protein